MAIVHPTYCCADCEDTDAQLYHFDFATDMTAHVAHGCEHFIHDHYQAQAPANWLAANAVAPTGPFEY